jgi:methyl-accepting chemotaxis protein
MKNIKLKIGTRLALAFGATIALTVMLGTVSLWSTSLMKNSYEFVSTHSLLAVRTMNDMASALEVMRRSELRVLSLAPGGKVKEEESYNEILAGLKKSNDAYAQLEAGASDSKTKALLDAFNLKLNSYVDTHRKLVEMDRAAGTDAGKQDELADYLYSGDNFKASNEARDALKDSVQYSYQVAEAHRVDAGASYSAAWQSMLFFAALTSVVGVALSILITRSLVKQLGCEPNEAVRIAGRIAEGDLSTPIMVKSGDQASLLYAIGAMRDSIVSIIGQVRQATDTISVASKEIANGNLDLSARTESQAGSLEETASSMEELTSTVRQNADHAREANQLTQIASQVAVKGGAVVSKVVDTMESINESAKKIVDIIGVIDGIAFQTNILALNAAVEAARAGEQGRGFAVVAAEVRNLAQRSAGAAKEIKVLIGDSVEKVGVGSKLVDQAGVTMNEIMASIERVTGIMGDIASTSQEQTAGIEQVNRAIIEMDNVTQQNAALVEQASAAAASMQEQAEGLVQVVKVFKLSDTESTLSIPNAAVALSGGRRPMPAASAADPYTHDSSVAKEPMQIVKLVGSTSGNHEWEEF